MKIAWIADYLLKEHLGGAQQTNARMINYGRKLGYEIEEITAKDFNTNIEADLVITNNITKFNINELIKLSKRIPTIRYEHDYWCSQMCPQLYDSTILNIFLSPLHKATSSGFAGRGIEGVFIPSPIDTEIFNNDGDIKRKENTVIWVGSTAGHKGFDLLLKYAKDNPEKKIKIVSFDYTKTDLPENVEFVGERHDKELAKLYKESEEFFHHPQHEAFGRTVAEAYLCGCKLNINGNIGAMSYDWDYSNYDEFKSNVQSENKFWNTINEKLNA